jgi:hypothetical protein
MELQIKIDNIISYAGNINFALIKDIQKHPEIEYYYKATLIENLFPQELIDLCKDFYECVDSFSMIIADEIEDEIKKYQLRLKYNNVKIFRLEIKSDYVTFYTKYPTSKGFFDDYLE